MACVHMKRKGRKRDNSWLLFDSLGWNCFSKTSLIKVVQLTLRWANYIYKIEVIFIKCLAKWDEQDRTFVSQYHLIKITEKLRGKERQVMYVFPH